jgi:hypothetical protein
MAGEATLIVTTRSGVRPLGVRGEPLYNAAPQLRRVVRRRLGDAAADLLADPQLHESDQGIDWYASWSGPVRPVTELPSAERDAVLGKVEATLAEIRRLGDLLAGHGPKEETGIVGLSLKLAARAPSPAFVFLVGDRPVIVAWGYEQEAANALLPLALARVPEARAPELHAPARRPVLEAAQMARPGLPAVIPATGVPWWRTLALALPLLLLLLGGAWLLRGLLPVVPDVAIATREGPPAPPPPEAAPDPMPALKAAYSTEHSRERVLKVELALAEAELKKRIADCKPPEPPKPPQVAAAPPPPMIPPTPKPAPPKAAPQPAPQPRNPGDDRLRLPNAPTNDYSFMQGCWRTDPFRHEALQLQPGVSSYCFDASGAGQLEWRRGRTACRTRAQARFEGTVLRLRDADSTCNDGSRWFSDELVCHRGSDNVAVCSGQSRNAYGAPVTWSVNLHKLN